MKRALLQKAYLLHRRPYREGSFLIELFSKDHGRFSVLAKGVRRPRSLMQGLLQPFVPLLVSFAGKGDLMSLSHAEIDGEATYLSGEHLFAGLYLNELLIRLLQPWDAHPGLYTAYEKVLSVLHSKPLQKNAVEQRALRSFEKCLLEELGYGLLPTSEVTLHNRFAADGYYRFIHNQGLVPCERPISLPEEAQAGTKATIDTVFSGKNLIAIALEQWEEEGCLADAKRLVKLVLAPLLGTRPLYSRRLFR